MRSTQGLTLIETIVAIAICSIVLAALANVSTSSLRESRAGNHKTQATQVLDTIGRRIAGGYDASLLAASGEPVVITSDGIVSLTNVGLADVADMTVTISNDGAYTVGFTTLDRYGVEVCYGPENSRRCVLGVTLGRQGA